MSAVSGSVANAAEYYQAASSAFDAAVESAGALEQVYLRIGHLPIKLEFAGTALVPALLPALRHLQVPDEAGGGFRIRIWDTGSTNIELPTSPWTNGSYEARGRHFDYDDGRVLYQDERFRMYFYQSGDVVLLDNDRREAVCWFRDARTIPYYESGAPLRTILQWWFEKQGLILVHSAAVGLESGGVLLAGQGGSGKSTTALLCLNSRLRYAADDYCLVEPEPHPVVHCLYSTGKIDAHNLTRVPHVAGFVRNKARLRDEKALVFINDHLPRKLIHSFPVRALLLPRITGARGTEIEPASRADGLRALAPSTIFQLAGTNNATFQRMVRFVRGVEIFHLLLGTDVEAIPEVIQEFLEHDKPGST